MSRAGDLGAGHRVARPILCSMLLWCVSSLSVAAPAVLWTVTQNGTAANSTDAFSAIVVGPSGDLYTCGDIVNTQWSSIVVRISPAGGVVWTRTRTDPGVHALGIATDSNSAAYVVGSYLEGGIIHIMTLDKYLSDGTLAWSRTYQQTPGRRTVGMDVEVSGTEIFVAGIVYEAAGQMHPAALLKYDLSGNLLAATTFMTNGTFDPDAAYPDFRSVQVAVDSFGELYWAYRLDALGAVEVRKTSRDLSLIWTLTVSGEPDLMGLGPSPSGVLVSTRSCISCPGFCCGPCGDLTTYETRLNRIGGDGELLWSVNHLEPGISNTLVFAIEPDPVSGFYLAGQTGWTVDNSWTRMAKINDDGSLAWSRSLPGWGWTAYPNFCVHREQASGIALGSGGRLYLCGMTDDYTSDGFVTALDLDGIIEAPAPAPGVPPSLSNSGAWLGANVLDPVWESGVDVWIVPRTPDAVRVRVYTSSGRLVRELAAPVPETGNRWKSCWDGLLRDESPVARGVYLIRIDGGGLRETLKLVVGTRTR